MMGYARRDYDFIGIATEVAATVRRCPWRQAFAAHAGFGKAQLDTVATNLDSIIVMSNRMLCPLSLPSWIR
jgi:hypothetical protein